MTRALRTLVVAALAACGTDASPGEPPLFPENYAATYQEVRDCRHSLEHDLMRVRILASPDAVTPYTGRGQPFPTGSIILKEQYDGGDTDCTGPILSYTVMQKLEDGASPETLGWTWQEVGEDRKIIDSPTASCVQCHRACGQAPDGFDGTCSLP